MLIFGHGKYGIAVGGEEDKPTTELIIYELKKAILPIGKKLNDVGKTTNELNTISRWRFDDAESVQVVIDALEVIKGNLK